MDKRDRRIKYLVVGLTALLIAVLVYIFLPGSAAKTVKVHRHHPAPVVVTPSPTVTPTPSPTPTTPTLGQYRHYYHTHHMHPMPMPAPVVTPAPQPVVTPTPQPAPPASTNTASGVSIPGMPQSLANCIWQRESTSGTNPAAGGNQFGIIPASGYNVSGDSVQQQEQVAGQIYSQSGGAAWAADGCPGT